MSTYKLQHGDLVLHGDDYSFVLAVIDDDYTICDNVFVLHQGPEAQRYTAIEVDRLYYPLTEDALHEIALEWLADSIELVDRMVYRLVRNKS